MIQCTNCGQQTPEGKFCSFCGQLLVKMSAPAKFCPDCGTSVSADQKFCAACGAALLAVTDSKPAAQALHIGDIGLLKGSIDLSTHIGMQTHISGPVNMHIGAKPGNSAEYTARGKKLLLQAAYQEAAQELKSAISQDPSDPTAKLFLGLALLRGRNPDALPASTIQQIEAHLVAVMDSQEARPIALIALGTIKYDYYLANGMKEGEPTIQAIKEQLSHIELSESEQELLLHIKASRRAKERLGLEW